MIFDLHHNSTFGCGQKSFLLLKTQMQFTIFPNLEKVENQLENLKIYGFQVTTCASGVITTNFTRLIPGACCSFWLAGLIRAHDWQQPPLICTQTVGHSVHTVYGCQKTQNKLIDQDEITGHFEAPGGWNSPQIL